MSLRKRIAAADPLHGSLPAELPLPPLPAGEAREIGYTGARRSLLPQRWAAFAVATGAAAVLGFVVANLVGTSADPERPAPAAPTRTETTETTLTETIPTVESNTETVMVPPDSVRTTTAEAVERDRTWALTVPGEGRSDTVVELSAPRSWEGADQSSRSITFGAIHGSCLTPVAVSADVVESAASADEQVRGALAGMESLSSGESMFSDQDAKGASGISRDGERLVGVSVIPLAAGRWIRVDAATSGDCSDAGQRLVDDFGALVMGVRRG